MAWWFDLLVDENAELAKCIDGVEAQRKGEHNEGNHDDGEECFAKFEQLSTPRRLMTVYWEHIETFDAVCLLFGVQRRVDWW